MTDNDQMTDNKDNNNEKQTSEKSYLTSDNITQNKKGFIEIEGEIIEMLPSGSFKVLLDNNHEILAHLSGKMRMFKIRLVVGDRVKLEISPYDLTKGRIIRRL